MKTKQEILSHFESQSMNRDRKRHVAIVFGSFAIGLVLLVTYLQIIQPFLGEVSGSRAPASIAGQIEPRWSARSLAGSLSQEVRNEKHLGRSPAAIDEFIYGELMGNYETQMRNGKVASLEFRAGYRGEFPMKRDNWNKFLIQNKEHFSLSFSEVEKLPVVADDENHIGYLAKRSGGEVAGKFELELDDSGNLLSLRVFSENM